MGVANLEGEADAAARQVAGGAAILPVIGFTANLSRSGLVHTGSSSKLRVLRTIGLQSAKP